MKKITYPKLPTKFKIKWLEALRSGDYKQTREGGLINGTIEDKNLSYCCLGVACRISNVPIDELYDNSFPEYMLPNIPDFLIYNPNEFVEGVYWQNKLAIMNDGIKRAEKTIKPKSFKQIANWIEKHL